MTGPGIRPYLKIRPTVFPSKPTCVSCSGTSNFEEAGLDPNKPPTTWEELWEYADKLDVEKCRWHLPAIAFFPLWNAGFKSVLGLS